MNAGSPARPQLAPLTFRVDVPLGRAEAFHAFVHEIHRWWPLATHSIFGGAAVRCGIEPRAGGVIFEENADGARAVWGTLSVWDPPARVVASWHPGRDEATAQEIELRFTALSARRTAVELEHRFWERLGPAAAETRRNYEGGWSAVLNERFVPFAMSRG